MSGGARIRWERDADGIVILTLDDPDQSANTMNVAFRADFGATVERLEGERDAIAGVILVSAKKTFFAGGDLNDLRRATKSDAEAITERGLLMKRQLRALETLGKPVVAAINGAALGGGLELCLACHHRIAVSDPRLPLGLPEVTLGLLPGAGGVVRTVRMLGLHDALTRVLLEGQRLSPQDALELGIVDELVERQEQLVPAARAWILAHPEAAQPWDREGYALPGGAAGSPELANDPRTDPEKLLAHLRGANYPAPRAIVATAFEGSNEDIDTAGEIETRYFVGLVTGQVAKNMIQAFFFDTRRVQGPRARPESIETFAPRKAVVVGAGMMGAGIAFVCAQAGLEVLLEDVTLEAAVRGKAYSERLVAKAVARGRSTQERADALLGRIVPSADPADAEGADLLIEAVFEDAELKAHVLAGFEPHLASDALLASNTSTLPITSLAESVPRPDSFVGLHFFSPVDRMPLLEIVRGKETSEETVFRALDVARLLRKTAIVVNDSRGFFTSRVIGTFLGEGAAMLAEGIPPATIEQASSVAGYPVPVLQLMDELNMELSVRIRRAAEDAGETADHPGDAVVARMVELGRPGRLRGAGFYEYVEGARGALWPGLTGEFRPIGDPGSIVMSDLTERMLFVESIEAVKCLAEGVLESVAEGNVGSILGIGFPGWTGGVFQYVNGYEDPSGRTTRHGVAGFVARARELAERHGERFEPPALLVETALHSRALEDPPAGAHAAG